MIFLQPMWTPLVRLRVIEESARRLSRSALVRSLVLRVRSTLPHFASSEQLAQGLLDLVSAPTWDGDTETDSSKGQWVDTDIAHVVNVGGDCVARTHALLALAYAAGIDARAEWFDEKPDALDHVAAMLHAGGRWQWADPLVHGALLGTAPRGRALPDARVLPA